MSGAGTDRDKIPTRPAAITYAQMQALQSEDDSATVYIRKDGAPVARVEKRDGVVYTTPL